MDSKEWIALAFGIRHRHGRPKKNAPISSLRVQQRAGTADVETKREAISDPCKAPCTTSVYNLRVQPEERQGAPLDPLRVRQHSSASVSSQLRFAKFLQALTKESESCR